MTMLPLAYINPGMGSFLMQIIVVSMSFVLMSLQSLWGAIRSFIIRKKKD